MDPTARPPEARERRQSEATRQARRLLLLHLLRPGHMARPTVATLDTRPRGTGRTT